MRLSEVAGGDEAATEELILAYCLEGAEEVAIGYRDGYDVEQLADVLVAGEGGQRGGELGQSVGVVEGHDRDACPVRSLSAICC